MAAIILRAIRFIGGRHVARKLNALLRRITAFTHRVQYLIEWGTTPTPIWFDHFLDQYYLWPKTGNPLGWERGIFGLLAMRQGARVLELCCGDGFNSRHFYSNRAGTITAIDFNPEAIAFAQRHNFAPNLKYLVADIRTEIPEGSFDNIVWDAGIDYLTEQEIDAVMAGIKARLKSGGILSGYTILEFGRGKLAHGNRYDFKSKQDLVRFLRPHFANVQVLETIYPTRHNLYFFAADSELPFDASWNRMIVENR
ncbi:MAG: class I SAM-dependent methyltransferase [Betaproteobacteria bacterium]